MRSLRGWSESERRCGANVTRCTRSTNAPRAASPRTACSLRKRMRRARRNRRWWISCTLVASLTYNSIFSRHTPALKAATRSCIFSSRVRLVCGSCEVCQTSVSCGVAYIQICCRRLCAEHVRRSVLLSVWVYCTRVWSVGCVIRVALAICYCMRREMMDVGRCPATVLVRGPHLRTLITVLTPSLLSAVVLESRTSKTRLHPG
jgi:hypothetical protein